MRKGFMLPTGGQILGLISGLAIGFFGGPTFLTTASNMASEFFLSMGVIIGTAFGIVLLIMIALLLFKAWYFMAPFIIGLVGGVLLNLFFASTFYNSLSLTIPVIRSV